MKCLRIYATPDGESHFDEVDGPLSVSPLSPNGMSVSSDYPASQIRFCHFPAGVGDAGWHNPPGRVIAISLDGFVELETSDGEIRRLPAGSCLLSEDTHGKGHISRHPAEGHDFILITLPDGLDAPSE